jgi:UDP-glucose 4-epimerase
VLDNFATGKREHLVPLQGRIDVIEGDIRYLNNVQEATRNADYVLHLAALPSVARSVRTPIESNDVNVHGTLNLLIAARDAGFKRVICGASSSAYGNSPVLPKVESMPSDPLSPYAVNKLAGELYCSVFTRVYGLEAVSLRYFNVFGPRQDPTSQYSAVIPHFIQALLAGERPVSFGHGEHSRDFTFAQNVVEASVLACTAPGVAGETINVACGERITLNQLVQIVCRLLGKDIEPIYEAPRPGDVLHSQVDITKASKLPHYKPGVSMEGRAADHRVAARRRRLLSGAPRPAAARDAAPAPGVRRRGVRGLRGVEVSPTPISHVTHEVLDVVRAPQATTRTARPNPVSRCDLPLPTIHPVSACARPEAWGRIRPLHQRVSMNPVLAFA